MACPRFFLDSPLAIGDVVVADLPSSELRHLCDVLRVRKGESLILVDPDGSAQQVTLVGLDHGCAQVHPTGRVAAVWEPHVTVVAGIAKGGKVDDAVQGAVEVGVEAFLPVLTARSVVKLDPRKRTERAARWRRVALAAAKQSQRFAVPHVEEPHTLREMDTELRGFDLLLVAWEEAETRSIHDAIAVSGIGASSRVAVVVGPEGGLTAEEVAGLEGFGALPVTLGPTILRAETAAVVAPALVIAELRSLHAREATA